MLGEATYWWLWVASMVFYSTNVVILVLLILERGGGRSGHGERDLVVGGGRSERKEA